MDTKVATKGILNKVGLKIFKQFPESLPQSSLVRGVAGLMTFPQLCSNSVGQL